MFEAILFYLLATVLLGSAVALITRTTPISAALLMVLAFVALAALYGVLSAGFLAVVQILVYAGGIVVLILFVIMLLNLQREDLLPMQVDAKQLVIGLIAVLLLVMLPLGLYSGYTGLWAVDVASIPPEFGQIREVSRVVFTDYILAFEVLALVLLTAMVGAVVLAKRRL